VTLLVLSPLVGCAPLAVLRPASGVLPDRSSEVGLGLVQLGPRPYVDERAQVIGQLWATHEPSQNLALTVLTAFDDSAVAGGLAVRWTPLRTSRLALGPEIEFGHAWGAASLGFAIRTVGENWLYTAPRIGNVGFDWTLGVPIGASIDLTHGFVLRGEAQLSWGELKYYNRRVHLAGGLAYQW
jgi:hypothetical protein